MENSVFIRLIAAISIPASASQTMHIFLTLLNSRTNDIVEDLCMPHHLTRQRTSMYSRLRYVNDTRNVNILVSMLLSVAFFCYVLHYLTAVKNGVTTRLVYISFRFKQVAISCRRMD